MERYPKMIEEARQYIDTQNFHQQGELEAYTFKEKEVYENFIKDITDKKLAPHEVMHISNLIRENFTFG